MTPEAITVAGVTIEPGERRDIAPMITESFLGERTTLPMAVLNGTEAGPRVFVTAAVHGDELNGIAACRQLLDVLDPVSLRGVVVVVPVVNVPGVQNGSRYLPDRRDLNRSFPGSHNGSMAARIARLVTEEVIDGSDVGIDLHTAANTRTNTPQVRIVEDDEAAHRLAIVFGAPFVLPSKLRAGSLRAVAHEQGVPVLTFEGGAPRRFDDDAIDVAVRGALRVLQHLDMIDDAPEPASREPMLLKASRWLRAERGGILELQCSAGELVHEGTPLWSTVSPLGHERASVEAEEDGYIIGATTVPLVQPGQAIVHIALPGDRLAAEDDPSDEEEETSDPDQDDD